MRIGGIGYVDPNGKLFIPNDVITALSIFDGSLLYGIYYPRSEESKTSFRHDFMLTPIPYNFWSRSGRLIIRVKEQSKALRIISKVLSDNNISILHCNTTRLGHRYSTLDFHVAIEKLDPKKISFSKKKGYYKETNECLDEITHIISSHHSDILFIDENNIHLSVGVRNRVNTGLHYFYYRSQEWIEAAEDDNKIIYEAFTFRYNEGNIHEEFGFIKSNTGGKLSHIISKVEGEIATTLPSICFISADTHYLNFRLVIVPKEAKNSFIKLNINYQRLSLPDSSRGLLSFFSARLSERYKIWKYNNQLYECRKGYGAGCLSFYMEDIYGYNVNNEMILKELQDWVSFIYKEAPNDLTHIKVTAQAESIYPDYIKKKFSLNILKSKTRKHDVFLSYSYKDQEKADELYRIFEKSNLSCYMSKNELRPGDIFDSDIKQNLLNSREVCILYSKDSKDSHWVTTEWAIAWALDKKVVPILLNMESNLVKEEHKPRLSTRQWIKFENTDDLIEYAKDIYIRRLMTYI